MGPRDLSEVELLVREGIDAAEAGDHARARELLGLAVSLDGKSFRGWLWLSGEVESLEEKVYCLQQALAADPGNEKSWQGLESLVESREEQRPCVQRVLAPSPGPKSSPQTVETPLMLAAEAGEVEVRLGGRTPFGAWDALRSVGWPGPASVAALGFLAGVAGAELLVTFVEPRLGLALHCLLLAGLLFHSTRVEGAGERAFLVSLAFAPLIRILSLSLPLTRFPTLYWYLITSLPLFVALFVAAPTLGYTWHELGLHLRKWWLQVLIGASGLVFGAVEYYILRPEPLAPALSLRQVWWPALVLLVSTGLLEEMIFRGLLQRAAGEALGRWGMAYVALLFATLHIGYRSWVDFLFVLGVGSFLGWVVKRTRSLLGVTLSHGLTNVVLFLVMPFVQG